MVINSTPFFWGVGGTSMAAISGIGGSSVGVTFYGGYASSTAAPTGVTSNPKDLGGPSSASALSMSGSGTGGDPSSGAGASSGGSGAGAGMSGPGSIVDISA